MGREGPPELQPAVVAVDGDVLEELLVAVRLGRPELVGPLGPSDPAFAAAATELGEIERSTVFFAGGAAKPTPRT